MELPPFFFRFQSKRGVLKVNKTEVTAEKTFNGVNFEIEVNHDSINDEEICFGYFCKFVTSALTFRPRNTYLYVFRTLSSF